jgi:hypothetical protein
MGLSHREIGALLDLSEEAARKRVERARTAFITAIRRDRPLAAPTVLFVRGAYDDDRFRAWVERAGGRFKPIDHGDVEREIATADALLLGASHRDVDPSVYGEPERFPDAALPTDAAADRRDLRALRVALTGAERGPELWAVLRALPRDDALRRALP